MHIGDSAGSYFGKALPSVSAVQITPVQAVHHRLEAGLIHREIVPERIDQVKDLPVRFADRVQVTQDIEVALPQRHTQAERRAGLVLQLVLRIEAVGIHPPRRRPEHEDQGARALRLYILEQGCLGAVRHGRLRPDTERDLHPRLLFHFLRQDEIYGIMIRLARQERQRAETGHPF